MAIENFTWNFQNCELYLFRFVLLTLLTSGIHFRFKRLGFDFRNLLLIKWFSRWKMTPKVTRIYCQLKQ
jgi:hypothetical protein